jgi:two-component system nitrogen regulation sensor histidine kinase NtrY
VRLRNRLIAAFLAATVLPLAATIWIATTLLDRSLGYATTGELDRLSRTLEATVRQFYQRERETLRQDAAAGRVVPAAFVGDASAWPAPVRAFWDSGEPERFGLSGPGGDHVDYMRREAGGVVAYRRDLHGIRMEDLSRQFRDTRELVGTIDARDLRRGFTLTLLLLLAVVWIVSLAPLVYIAHRVSRPIQQLTAGLTDFAGGDWTRRVDTTRDDEVGKAVTAFNEMAQQLRQNRERLVHLTQMASWQSLARKTAHELKNSLTPIRLTVEEMLARQPPADRAFMDQAVQIVVSEIDALERRVRAFSDFAAEPPVRAATVDINALIAERIAFVRLTHPETQYDLALDGRAPQAWADVDLVKGMLTNLVQNAAEAAGPAGCVRVRSRASDGAAVAIEVHDSGPGLSVDASATLFEPTITFKKDGMGLGLSIAKKNALLCGGDITTIESELGGAAFKVVLPCAPQPADGSVRPS